MQVVRDLLQGHNLGTELLCQQLGPLQGPVRHHHPGHALLAQVAGHQFDGFAGAHQQHLGLGEVGEDTAGQAHGGEGHRHRAGADLGVSAHPFGHREGFLEQALQGSFHRIRLLGVGVGLLDLPQDLRLPEHQGVEAAGHPHQVPHRFLVLVPVDGGEHLARLQRVEPLQPVQHLLPLPLLQAAIELGAVAGGDDHRLADARLLHQLTQGAIDAVRAKGDPLPQGDTGGVVVDSEGKQTHGWVMIVSCTGCRGRQLYEKG